MDHYTRHLSALLKKKPLQQIHQNLQSRIVQLDSELRTMLAQRYHGPTNSMILSKVMESCYLPRKVPLPQILSNSLVSFKMNKFKTLIPFLFFRTSFAERTEHLETKVDSISAQLQQIHQNLQSRIVRNQRTDYKQVVEVGMVCRKVHRCQRLEEILV